MRILLAILALLGCAASASAQIDSAPKVQARLIAESGEIPPGGTVAVALEQNIRPGWHTYWTNPGEAGLPTEVKWSLPPGWRAGPIEWPYPKRLPVGPLMNYGYEGKVWLLTKITAPRGAKSGSPVTLKATGSWLVCKEVCIPEDQPLLLQLTVSASPAQSYATIEEQFRDASAKIPTRSPWPITFHLGNSLDLFVASPALAQTPLKGAVFFPFSSGAIVDYAPQAFAPADGGLVLRLQHAKKPKIGAALSGVVVLTSADGAAQALRVAAKPGAVPEARFGAAHEAGPGLGLAVLFAFLGGLILNVMPCVLPILAMKALAVAETVHGDRPAARRHALAYGGGTVVSFLAFAISISGLRAGGEAIGWGFQLQNSAVVSGFALLIFAVGLNLSGVFDVPGMGAGETLTRRGGATGSFFTGVLAVAVAAPCTAPFMAAALGYALTQRLVTSLLVFLALGIGFATPFVLIGLAPAIGRWLPKPGPWMVRFRQLLAFPMYATALWLAWVLSFETDVSHLLLLFASALILAFGLWMFGSTQGRSAGWRAAGWVILALSTLTAPMLLADIQHGTRVPTSVAPMGDFPAQPYSRARLDRLRAQHRSVFINATAAWCITCLVNEKTAFSSPNVQTAFTRRHIAYLVADWTNRNPEITSLLEEHGRSGVPLYLYYPSDTEEPIVLPQVLTPTEVLKAVGS
ncbi:MAG: thioredoxin family protein [Alphaproteobacteria bacterium]|nr:thioredoxin family protein [Alphaproteobacteria bacterium]